MKIKCSVKRYERHQRSAVINIDKSIHQRSAVINIVEFLFVNFRFTTNWDKIPTTKEPTQIV